jgi:hypothetical protein
LANASVERSTIAGVFICPLSYTDEVKIEDAGIFGGLCGTCLGGGVGIVAGATVVVAQYAATGNDNT